MLTGEIHIEGLLSMLDSYKRNFRTADYYEFMRNFIRVFEIAPGANTEKLRDEDLNTFLNAVREIVEERFPDKNFDQYITERYGAMPEDWFEVWWFKRTREENT